MRCIVREGVSPHTAGVSNEGGGGGGGAVATGHASLERGTHSTLGVRGLEVGHQVTQGACFPD